MPACPVVGRKFEKKFEKIVPACPVVGKTVPAPVDSIPTKTSLKVDKTKDTSNKDLHENSEVEVTAKKASFIPIVSYKL